MKSEHKPNFHICIQDKKVCREEEIEYCKQIYKEYIQKNGQQHMIRRMFQILHSDWLNIEESTIEYKEQRLKVLKSKVKYQAGDIVLQVRGSIIERRKLDLLMKEKVAVKKMLQKVNCLLWGQKQSQVLVPKGLSRTLLNGGAQYSSFLQNNKENKNCIVQYELGAKYLISSSRQIQAGQILVLDIQSVKRFQYSHESL